MRVINSSSVKVVDVMDIYEYKFGDTITQGLKTLNRKDVELFIIYHNITCSDIIDLLKAFETKNIQNNKELYEQVTYYINNACKIKRIKQKAEKFNLQYWPALFGPKIDIKAYKIAEDILAKKYNGYYGDKLKNDDIHHGGWDSYGYHGLSPQDVSKMWYNAGCKNNIKFRLQVYHKIIIPKSVTIKKTISYVKGYNWCKNNFRHLTFNKKALCILGNLSPHSRWAAMSGVSNSGHYYIKHNMLNYEAVKQVQSKRNFIKAKYCPNRLIWQMVYKVEPPNGLNEINPLEYKVSIKLFKQLCKIAKIDPFYQFNKQDTETAISTRLSCWSLSCLFKSVQEVQKLIGNKLDPLLLHNGGQFNPPKYVTNEWKRLVLKYKYDIIEYIDKWESIDKLLGTTPTTLSEVRIAASKIKYVGGIKELVEPAALANLSQSKFDKLCNIWCKLKIKTAESIPAPLNISNNKYRLEQLPYNSPYALLMGKYTNCCQHVFNAAKSCAKKSVTSKRAAVWVVYDSNNKIIAQAYVWRYKNTVVIDSIESKDKKCAQRVVDLFTKAASNIIGRLCVKHVHIGKTNYGITKDVVTLMGLNKIKTVDGCPSEYSDARIQYRIV